MKNNLFDSFVTRVSEVISRNVRAYFMPEISTGIPVPGQHGDSEATWCEQEWELNQGYSDIAVRDLNAILQWLLPSRARQGIRKFIDKAMIYYFTDEIVFLEDNDLRIRTESFPTGGHIKPKILCLKAWGNLQARHQTISLEKEWAVMVRRWVILNRVKILLKNVTFLCQSVLLSCLSIPFNSMRCDLNRIYIKIGTLIFPKRN